ncbi:MAG: hypothetical protein K6G00_09210 [Treponema sp.]|nr:hypothetical protein [Treponema sp.]
MEKEKKKTKKKIGLGLFACAALAAGYVGFTRLSLNSQQEAERLEHIVSSLQEEYVPMKFKVDYKEDKTAEVSIKYYDQDGKQTSRMSYIVNGTELFFDFKVIHLASKDAYFFFPYSIYTNVTEPANGIHICDDYTENGMPLIYKAKNLGEQEDIQFFTDLLSYAKTGNGVNEVDLEYGYSVHDLNDFNIHFMRDTTYKVVCHKQKGGIEILED